MPTLLSNGIETWIEAFENTDLGGLSEEGIKELLGILYRCRRHEDDLHWIVELVESKESFEVRMNKMVETATDGLAYVPEE